MNSDVVAISEEAYQISAKESDGICIVVSGIKQEKMASAEGSRFQIGMVGSLALSVASSVSIVICNKALMSSLGFPFGQ